MADIFLSYTEKDREAVRRLAETLQSAGWSVWWDRRIPAGLTWRSVLERELQSMRCMVVLWSSHSIASEWVCEEAAEGRQLGRLVPVLIEPVRPPPGFREIQAADLVDWDGSRDFLGLRQLLEDIERLIGKPGAAVPVTATSVPAHDAPAPPTPQSFPWGMSALLVAIAIGAYYGSVSRRPPVARGDSAQATLKASAPAPRASLPQSTTTAQAVKEPAKLASSAARIPVMASGSAPPVRAPGSAPPAGARPEPDSWSIGARCAALRDRFALGQSVSSKSQLFFHQECSK